MDGWVDGFGGWMQWDVVRIFGTRWLCETVSVLRGKVAWDAVLAVESGWGDSLGVEFEVVWDESSPKINDRSPVTLRTPLGFCRGVRDGWMGGGGAHARWESDGMGWRVMECNGV